MKIGINNFILTKFIQKMYGATHRLHFPQKIQFAFYKVHYKRMQKILSPYFYKILEMQNHPFYKGLHNNRIIWMFWWQGKKSMPTIVKKCILSIKCHSKGHKVILIDRFNITKYTNIPKYIYKKVDKHIIDFTHFSDIVRFNVLKNHGGLWIDSTMYCAKDLGPEYFNNYLYTSGGYSNTNPPFVKGRWVEGLIGGNKNNNMFKFMDDFNRLYWRKNNLLIHYFMEDYVFEFIYSHNIGGFKTYVDNYAQGNNPYLFKFIDLLNKPYNKQVYHKIIKDTSLFNLTYKKKFINNGKTFYSKILN